MATLYNELREVNPLAQLYKTMKEVHDTYTASGEDVPNLTIVFNSDRVLDQRTYNAPTSTSNEVAALLIGTPTHHEQCKTLSVSLRHAGNSFRTIKTIDPNADALIYPLLFPRGDRGWYPDMEAQERPRPNKRRARAPVPENTEALQPDPNSMIDDEADDEDDPPYPLQTQRVSSLRLSHPVGEGREP